VIFSFVFFSGMLYAQRVVVTEGTRVQVRLKADLLSNQAKEGKAVYFEVARPVMVEGLVAIPAGADAWGTVQSVKEDKLIKFDVVRLRLPDLTEISLRCTREKSKKSSKDQLKVDSEFGDTVGAPKGTEFQVYVDESISVQAAAATPSPAPAGIAPPAPAPAPEAPVPAPPAEPVTLNCNSDPTGADIVIDGDFRGTTPSILKIPPGKHHLEFQLSGYNVFSRDLDLKSGTGVQTIQPTLQKKE
jgi:hypothetical protein